MSILIKDMEMPERCLECPLYDNYNYYCTLYSFGIPARHNRDGSTRPEWCELVEVVRCNDCKHADEYYQCDYSAIWNDKNHYCGKGERKDG